MLKNPHLETTKMNGYANIPHQDIVHSQATPVKLAACSLRRIDRLDTPLFGQPANQINLLESLLRIKVGRLKEIFII